MAINTDSQVDLMQQQYGHWGRDGKIFLPFLLLSGVHNSSSIFPSQSLSKPSPGTDTDGVHGWNYIKHILCFYMKTNNLNSIKGILRSHKLKTDRIDKDQKDKRRKDKQGSTKHYTEKCPLISIVITYTSSW
jgi:hypothetical protein